jgi:hypothetical protein
MREINLSLGQGLSLTIAADARVSTTNYVDDQIWEITQNSGEPPAIALQTTYGLRATKMRMFPRFSEAHESLTDPRNFSKPPIIRRLFPNYIEISYAPYDSIEVLSDYWAPASNAVSGRIRITNKGSQNKKISFEWVSLLSPSQDGYQITPQEIESVPVLVGATGNIAPVIFITGGASTVNSPYPALVHGLDLPPGKSRQFIWCQAALSSPEESFTQAREISSRNWQAEIANLELQNSTQVEIYTGNEEWDNAFVLAQKTAFNLFMGKTSHLEQISFISTRKPDDGFSLRGDGSDYGPLWNGQTPLDSFYLANLCLPSAPNLAAGILINSLNSINENGEIDWKPGLGGQLSNRLATPILASLAWKIYELLEDKDFLVQVFPKLLKLFFSWFSPEHDRDEDGIPEWDHPIQAGFEDHPLFARWHQWAEGIDITTTESPSLCAFLYRECQVIIRIARLIDKKEPVADLEAFGERLRNAVENAWNEQIGGYLYWDRDSHISNEKTVISDQIGSGITQINQTFTNPQRLVFRIKTKEETTRYSQITIHGLSPSGKHRVEQIPTERLFWFPGWGTATSEQIYSSIEFVDIQGLGEDDSLTITSADLSSQDITTLLPIWAGIPSNERAKKLVDKNITNPNRYWREFGLPACPNKDTDSENDVCQSVFLPWCLLIAEGLIFYGYREETGELVTRLMNGILDSLKREGCFRQYYNADTGHGFGVSNTLWGLAPVGLFLETLGVQLISPWKVRLAGKNPFPWPVTVKYRGMTVLRGQNKTQVVFPDGQTISTEDPEPCLISLE